MSKEKRDDCPVKREEGNYWTIKEIIALSNGIEVSTGLEEKRDFSVKSSGLKYWVTNELKAYLDETGGVEGSLKDIYLRIYSCAEINEFSEGNAIEEFLPGYTLVGAVNDEALVLGKNSKYYQVPFETMLEEDLIEIASSLTELLNK